MKRSSRQKESGKRAEGRLAEAAGRATLLLRRIARECGTDPEAVLRRMVRCAGAAWLKIRFTGAWYEFAAIDGNVGRLRNGKQGRALVMMMLNPGAMIHVDIINSAADAKPHRVALPPPDRPTVAAAPEDPENEEIEVGIPACDWDDVGGLWQEAGGPVGDSRALREIRERLAELRTLIPSARERGDFDCARELEEEHLLLQKLLRDYVNPKTGRQRLMGSDEAHRKAHQCRMLIDRAIASLVTRHALPWG